MTSLSLRDISPFRRDNAWWHLTVHYMRVASLRLYPLEFAEKIKQYSAKRPAEFSAGL